MHDSPAVPTSPVPVRNGLLQRIASGGVVSGGLLLLVSATIVNLGNYLFNLMMGRWLGPAAFADISLVVTLFLVVALLTATAQTISAKFAAMHSAANSPTTVQAFQRGLSWVAWLVGGVMAAGFILGAPMLQRFFNAGSALPFVFLGIGLPFYLVQGVHRGALQGKLAFLRLAGSYQTEMWARLGLGVVLVGAGLGVNGAAAALGLSFVATWAVVAPWGMLPSPTALNAENRRQALAFAWPVLLAQMGQITINNSDVLLVKRFFLPEEAGHYAALSLIGRLVFFATWSVVTVLLPAVAQRHQNNQPHRHLLWASLGLVGLVSTFVVGVCIFYGEAVVGALFGPAYLSVADLLWQYALATTLFALANVLVVYRLSLNQYRGAKLAFAAGLGQIIGITLFHDSLAQVVMVQVTLMAVLALVLVLLEVVYAPRFGSKR